VSARKLSHRRAGHSMPRPAAESRRPNS
jgi:hypothetical protein